MTTRILPLKYALRSVTPGHVKIKGDVAQQEADGLLPGYSASGQDVWLRPQEAQFRGGGLILSAVGARCGKVFLADSARWGVVANTTVLVPQQGFDARYLWYLVNDEHFWEKGGAAQPYIRVQETLQRRLPFPDLDEQRRIAAFLDAEFAKVHHLTSLLEMVSVRVHERRLGQVYDLVTGAASSTKTASTLPWLRELPSDWPVVKLTYVAQLGSGHTPSRSHPEWWTDCYIPWITTGEVQQVRDDRLEVLTTTRESISALGLANSSAEVHPAGTVVLCRTASAGYSAVMGSDMATSQDFATWTCGPRLDPLFLLWCLRAMRPDLLGRLAMGSTHKTIYMPDIQSIRVPLPTKEEQQQIVREIKERNASLDGLLDRIDRQRQLLTERRAALVTAAVTGQLDVTTARGAA